MNTLIGIFTCDRFAHRQQWCQPHVKSLRQAGYDVLFVLGGGDGLVGDKLYLPCPTTYPLLPQRTRLLAKYAYDRGYDFVFKCDDDTFIDVEIFQQNKLTDFLGNSNYWAALGGDGYFLSRREMEVVIRDLHVEAGCEDQETSRVLIAAGIPFTNGLLGTRHGHDKHLKPPLPPPSVDEYLRILHDRTAPYGLHGSGIVTGLWEDNDRADLAIKIGLTITREVWDGPIQVWHGKHRPLSPEDAGRLRVDQVAFHEVIKWMPDVVHSWGLKSLALKYCGYERGLWLDGPDAYLVADPRPVFDALDAHDIVYWANGAFWDKFTCRDLNPRGNKLPPILQGGQFAVHCVRGANLIAAQRYIDNHAAGYWPRDGWDQDGWRIALSYGLNPYQCVPQPPWNNIAWTPTYRDQVLVVHRCNAKLWRGQSNWCDALPKEKRVRMLFELFGGGCTHCPQQQAPHESQQDRKRRLRAHRKKVLGR